MGRVSESIFAFMHRNATRPARYFALPDNKVVSLGTHIDLQRRISPRWAAG